MSFLLLFPAVNFYQLCLTITFFLFTLYQSFNTYVYVFTSLFSFFCSELFFFFYTPLCTSSSMPPYVPFISQKPLFVGTHKKLTKMWFSRFILSRLWNCHSLSIFSPLLSTYADENFFCKKQPSCCCFKFQQMVVILTIIDAVNQGNWSLSFKLRFECFVIVE